MLHCVIESTVMQDLQGQLVNCMTPARKLARITKTRPHWAHGPNRCQFRPLVALEASRSSGFGCNGTEIGSVPAGLHWFQRSHMHRPQNMCYAVRNISILYYGGSLWGRSVGEAATSHALALCRSGQYLVDPSLIGVDMRPLQIMTMTGMEVNPDSRLCPKSTLRKNSAVSLFGSGEELWHMIFLPSGSKRD